MSAESIVLFFFIVSGAIVLAALLIIGISFTVMTVKRIKEPELNDREYLIYLKKGYVLRFCYGCCVAADTLLTIFEIAATGTGTFIALIPDAPAHLVAIMLITTFITSTFCNALNLKHLRKAYAKAFRILEFAVDRYRISAQSWLNKRDLQKANEEAQRIIEEFNE